LGRNIGGTRGRYRRHGGQGFCRHQRCDRNGWPQPGLHYAVVNFGDYPRELERVLIEDFDALPQY